MFVVFAFKIKVSIILKLIQLNYHLTQRNRMVCTGGLGEGEGGGGSYFFIRG